MALISAKCPHCGADIRVNEGSKSGVCEFCGATFVTQDAVTNYTVNNNYNTVQYITKTAASAAEAGEYIRRGDVLLSLGEFGRAEEAYLRAVELEPADWRGWFGMVKTRTKNFTDYEDTRPHRRLRRCREFVKSIFPECPMNEMSVCVSLFRQYLSVSVRILHRC